MVYRSFRPIFGLLLSLTLSIALSACGNSNGVPSSQSQPAGAAPATSNPPSNAAAGAAMQPQSGAAPGAPAPTQNPVIKQAQMQPGVPVSVPESMKRPLTPAELQKAMEQMPPEVRARIMGMGQQKMPIPSPQPAKK